MMKAPSFWFRKAGLLAWILSPLAWIYTFIHKVRWKISRSTVSLLPILCVGNTGIGGAGKTPTALALGKIFKELSIPFSYLTRGYGGKSLGPLFVNPTTYLYEEVGDEPLLLARLAPTMMAKNRNQGLRKIEETKSQLIIMDDGYQNPTLQKTTHLLVIDGSQGFGNGHVFPAGPLREPLAMSMMRASAVIMLGLPSPHVSYVLKTLDCPIFYGRLVLKLPKNLSPSLYAFAGIASPEKFFSSLSTAGFPPIKTWAFPDHHPYKEKEIQSLIQEAQKAGATLVTTEKDFVRLSRSQRSHILPLPVQIEWENEQTLKEFLKTCVIL